MKRLKNGLVFEGVKLVVVKSERQITLVNKFNGYAEIVDTEMVNEYPFILFKKAKEIGCGIPSLEHLLATLNGINYLNKFEQEVVKTLIINEEDQEDQEEEDE